MSAELEFSQRAVERRRWRLPRVGRWWRWTGLAIVALVAIGSFFVDEPLRRLSVQNVSNHFAEGPAVVRVRGKFMRSGATDAAVSFRPTSKGPDLDVAVKIENTDMTAINEILSHRLRQAPHARGAGLRPRAGSGEDLGAPDVTSA